MINMSAFGKIFFSIIIVVALTGCGGKKDRKPGKQPEDTTTIIPVIGTTPVKVERKVASETVQPDSLVAFAKTLIGTPYLFYTQYKKIFISPPTSHQLNKLPRR